MNVTVFMATSLDGFIADENGGVDWLKDLPISEDDTEDYGFATLMQSVDRLVMGRKTFDQVLQFGSWPYGDTPVTVLTHQPPPRLLPEGSKVFFAEGSPEALVQQLASEGVAHIYLDGGDIVQQFLAAGFLDEIILTQVPVLLGQGISLFKEELSTDIWLVERVTNYPNGFVQTHLIKKGAR
ncbi:MAG: dihydrofolate reductase [Candidatus Marinimicrobia bacterium]|jgi:dihydrofolate reductase|nr:dihydrofolate reductase [Candidatus Neomarinimicrobiota bacterium]MBT4714055.1 dihydrofolate reductase [Candidatus Neomarinimicrobiota bacterium]MBT4944536.1 dihydrofolate reductase [Candidatus Neomarinimicrobiota bacterium]MBT5271604.1 dihydrofolate reductase [Candidatus Neomarinimicrobiota bacterium]MBT6012781.1 dihydrofolate reductase [Candidatus Neomarinimicrobiota bacterium]